LGKKTNITTHVLDAIHISTKEKSAQESSLTAENTQMNASGNASTAQNLAKSMDQR
jgi:hypothetical protein